MTNTHYLLTLLRFIPRSFQIVADHLAAEVINWVCTCVPLCVCLFAHKKRNIKKKINK